MSETNYSTGDSGTTISRPSLPARWLAFAALVLAAVALVVWIRNVTWQRVAQLEGEFATIESERFLLGLHARDSMARMNAALLRFQLSGDLDEREAFHRMHRELTNRFARTFPELTTPAEREVAQQFRSAFNDYIEGTADMIERSLRGIRKDTASQVHDLIEEKSRHASRLAEELVVAQNRAWTVFFEHSAEALAALRRMLWVSVIALLALAALSALLAYGTWVAPLRAQLNQSQITLERQEKLASLGTLAAGVAHEIRNPLQAIKMRLFSLRRRLPEEWREQEDLALISGEINRLEKIVQDTLQFARPGEPEMKRVAVSEIINNVSHLLGGPLQKAGVEFRVQSPDDLFVRADRQQLQQVLINLVQNGAESIDGAGHVSIDVRPATAALRGESQPVVVVEVTDTGRGIPREAERRIFDPFFSTREGGTGLGLPIAARIVEKHGGVIQYATERGRGTTFKVILPRDHGNERTDSAD